MGRGEGGEGREEKEEKPQRDRPDGGEDRPQWTWRIAFLCAAIGSAVGLGNIWRFPYLCNKHGGGAFLVPYLIALLLIGHPVLQLELAMGQKYRAGDIDAFGAVNKRCRGIGLASIFGAFVMVCYYCAILSWAVYYFFESFQDPLPWAGYENTDTASVCNFVSDPSILNGGSPVFDDCSGPEASTAMCLPFASSDDSKWSCPNFNASDLSSVACTFTSVSDNSGGHLFGDVLMLEGDGMFETKGVINGGLVGGLILIYLMIFASIYKGVVSASRVVLFTMPVPFLLLVCLFFRGVTLEGADIGIKEYMNVDGSKITSLALSDAIGQAFFSLSVCMGVMTAYASYNPPTQNVVVDNHIIAFGDTFTSFIGGFVIYSTLGHLSLTQGPGVFSAGGISLAFKAYPQALATMPGANGWSAIFFLSLVLLGIDSAFSLIEALSTVIMDRFGNKKQPQIVGIICIVGFLMGLLFVCDVGLYWLDIFDFYLNRGMVFIAALETIAVGWCYNLDDQMKVVGKWPVIMYNGSFFLIVIVAIWFGLGMATPVFTTTCGKEVMEYAGVLGSYSVIPSLFLGSFAFLFMAEAAVIKARNFRKDQNLSAMDHATLFWELGGWHCPDMLRQMMNNPENKEELKNLDWKTTLLNMHMCGPQWGFLIKYLCPPVLILVLMAGVRDNWYFPYEGYPPTGQAIGGGIVFIQILMVIIPMIEPDVMKGWMEGGKPGVGAEAPAEVEMKNVSQDTNDNQVTNNDQGDQAC